MSRGALIFRASELMGNEVPRLAIPSSMVSSIMACLSIFVRDHLAVLDC